MTVTLLLALVPPPPTTFYGHVIGDDTFEPAVGMTVIAWIHDTNCGQGQILQEGDQLVYTVDVHADSIERSGCGIEGAEVRFQIGNQFMAATGIWGNTQSRALDLDGPATVEPTSTPTEPTPAMTVEPTAIDTPTPTSTPTLTVTMEPIATNTPTPTRSLTPTVTPTPVLTPIPGHAIHLPILIK